MSTLLLTLLLGKFHIYDHLPAMYPELEEQHEEVVSGIVKGAGPTGVTDTVSSGGGAFSATSVKAESTANEEDINDDNQCPPTATPASQTPVTGKKSQSIRK